VAEEGQGRGFAASCEAAHGTARRVRRRGASTAVLGVRVGRWRRVAMPRSFRETPEARRGLGRGAWPAALANAVVTARTEREV